MSKYQTPATEKLPDNCPNCRADNYPQKWFILKKQTISGGAMVYPYCCRHCGYRSAICEKRDTVLDWLHEHGKNTDALEWHVKAID